MRYTLLHEILGIPDTLESLELLSRPDALDSLELISNSSKFTIFLRSTLHQ
jgi:hypothetical protein